MSTTLPRGAERVLDYTAADATEILYCRISLARDWKAELKGTYREAERTLVLDHKRDARTARRYVRLAPGKSVQLELALAEGFFGRFSIPVLDRIGAARTEGRKKQLAAEYEQTRNHAITRWGDYPKMARAGQGMTYEPLGPARLPDVTVAIIPAEEDETTKDDPRYRPVRLRALYGLGDFVDAEHLCNPGGFMGRVRQDEERAAADFAASTQRDRMAEMEGRLATLMALLAANPELAAKAQAISSQPPPKGR
jgi:hypothetical protein